MEQIMVRLMVFLLLFFYTITDLRTKLIWWPLSLMVGIGGTALNYFSGSAEFPQCFLGVLPAFVLTAASIVTREAIGLGDCTVVAVCGILLGLSCVMELLLLAFLFAALWGIFMVAAGKAHKDTKMAFMPFMLAAYTGLLLL